MKKIKILELTNFSAGGCGVFARVKQEASLLKKEGFEVKIFSSNLEKGTNKIMPEKDTFEGVKIKRFPATRLGGESFMKWNPEEEAIKYHPDIIIAHGYRQYPTLSSLRIAKRINAKVFLVTHAPFDRDSSRSLASRIAVWLFDKFIAKRLLRKYNKIISITNWERPFLAKLGINKSKIVYLPNGITSNFFFPSKDKEKNKILYMGRITPIKDIETLIKSVYFLRDKKVILEIYGPAEKEYYTKLLALIEKLNLNKRVFITNKIYDSSLQIKNLDSSKIFVLPSLSEGMPQVLIEALARKKIVIASNNKGSADIIQNGKNGFLFSIGSARELANKIDYSLPLRGAELSKIKNNARNTAEKYKWSHIIKELIKEIHKT